MKLSVKLLFLKKNKSYIYKIIFERIKNA